MPATIKLTPDSSFNGSDALASFVNANEAAIIAETHDVPEQFEGGAFLAGAVFNNSHRLAGARHQQQRGAAPVRAQHLQRLPLDRGGRRLPADHPALPGQRGVLSGFLTGTTVSDPVTGQLRTFNDLARRRADLKAQRLPG